MSFSDTFESRFQIPTQNSDLTKSISITEYAPRVFDNLRQKDSIETSQLTYLLKSKDNVNEVIENARNKGGRGGSFFYFTSDQRFIIKSLKGHEKKVLLGKFL